MMFRRSATLRAALFAIAAGFATVAQASAAVTLNASFVVTYYSDPAGSQYGSQCVNFQKTGSKDGETVGKWSSPTLAGWSGYWIQKGEHFSWFGSYVSGSVTYSTFDVGDFVNASLASETSAAAFNAVGGAPLFTGTATLTLVKNCNEASAPFSPLLRRP
jgi:hypothetical protein